ncbi:MAG: protein containing prepilin-type N- cleavage/methylation domain protein [Sulfurimonas sp.]|nr:MAG: protein containing prepilin-type N- cleavage/methylation domain protein [Sulfurimonas sp.]
MLELVFVIVIMGIIGKFGFEFLARAYQSFIFTSVNHTLQENSATALEFISKRLQYRIKDSVIARIPGVRFDALASINQAQALQYTVLEWISTDIDGFRGNALPFWSGIIDVDDAVAINSNGALLVSPATNTAALNALIANLSNSTLADAALYFVGSTSDITLDYGWDQNALQNQNASMHPIDASNARVDAFIPFVGNFRGVDIYEYYKLSWTASALVLNNITGDLFFHTDYQPWLGENFNNVIRPSLLMQNVDTFKFRAVGSLIKIQICVNNNLIQGNYSICKEKTIY